MVREVWTIMLWGLGGRGSRGDVAQYGPDGAFLLAVAFVLSHTISDEPTEARNEKLLRASWPSVMGCMC